MQPTSNTAVYWEYGSEGLSTGTFLGLNPKDFTLQWSIPDPKGSSRWFGDWYYQYDETASVVTVREPSAMTLRSEFPVDASLWYFMPKLAEDVLVFRTDGVARGIDAFDGRILWTRTVGEGYGFNKVIDGTLYLLGEKLWSIEPRTGRDLWSLAVEAETNDLAVGADRVWVSTRNRRIRALDRRSGRVTVMPFSVGADVLKMWALSDDELVVLVLERGQVREAVWRLVVR